MFETVRSIWRCYVGMGGTVNSAASQQAHSVRAGVMQHMQYRLDLLGAPCLMITDPSDDEAVRKMLEILELPANASKALFRAKKGNRLIHVKDNRQVFPSVTQ